MSELDYLKIQLRIKEAEFFGSGKRNGAHLDISVVCYREGLAESINEIKKMIEDKTK